MNIPPITGDGIVVNTAPTLPNIPMTTIKTPLATITMRLPTFKKKRKKKKRPLSVVVPRQYTHVMLIYKCIRLSKDLPDKLFLANAEAHLTFVIPRAPTFSLYEVVPFPVPQAPASRQPSPSMPIPLLIACLGGGGAPDSLAQAW